MYQSNILRKCNRIQQFYRQTTTVETDRKLWSFQIAALGFYSKKLGDEHQDILQFIFFFNYKLPDFQAFEATTSNCWTQRPHLNLLSQFLFIQMAPLLVLMYLVFSVFLDILSFHVALCFHFLTIYATEKRKRRMCHTFSSFLQKLKPHSLQLLKFIFDHIQVCIV